MLDLRVMQVMAGAPVGGAEAFFERLALALDRARIEQHLVMRDEPVRRVRLGRLGVEATVAPFRGPLDLCSRWRLVRTIEEFHPDIVITWMSRATAAMPPRVLMRHRRFIHVARLGGYYDLKYFRRADWLVANTPDIREHIRRSGWPPERVEVLPNFVDARPAPPVDRSSLGVPDGAAIVLALGRLHRNKAFDVLITAIARVAEVHLCVAGDGPEREALVALAQHCGVGERVHFLGWREDVAALLATADLLVCPSRHEPLGNVIIEAWAHRRPVIAAASQGPRQLIHDGIDGVLVPVDDSEALAATLRNLIDDRDRAAGLAARGRAAYEAGYTEAAVVARYREFFRRITERH
jgi:glycosyltransferase involved in cell wall biosynthesis